MQELEPNLDHLVKGVYETDQAFELRKSMHTINLKEDERERRERVNSLP